MTNIWFISDTHFFHANILKFTDANGMRIRHPFETVQEMNETMVDNWNAVIKPGDHVWHLGDVTFQYHEGFNKLMGKLHGQKRLILGNHDKLPNPLLQKHFKKIALWRQFKEDGFTATHVPMPDQIRNGPINLHGHIHQNIHPNPRCLNICVERTGYRPVHMDEVKQYVKRYKEKYE